MLLFLNIVQLLQVQTCIKTMLHNLTIQKSFRRASLPVCIAQPRPRPPAWLWSARPVAPPAAAAAPATYLPPSVPGSPSPEDSQHFTPAHSSDSYNATCNITFAFPSCRLFRPDHLISPVSLYEAFAAVPAASGSPPAAFPFHAADPQAPSSSPHCHPVSPDQIPPSDC